MNLKNYSLFPTLVSYASNFLNIDQCKRIKKYVYKSSLKTKFTKQASIVGGSNSLSTYSKHIDMIAHIEQNVEDCKRCWASDE